jgi:hypothetical protein
MAAFLFVTASLALLAGLIGLIAGHVPRTTGRKKTHAFPLRPSPRRGLTRANTTRRQPARGKEVNPSQAYRETRSPSKAGALQCSRQDAREALITPEGLRQAVVQEGSSTSRVSTF